MSTHSMIGIERAAGDDGVRPVTGIYCHFDGYLSHVGRLLATHYTAPEKIEALMALGCLSSLGAELGEAHDFNAPPKGVCNAYGRDGGERDVAAREYPSRDAFACEEFNYLFSDGQWFVLEPSLGAPLGISTRAWEPLSEAVAQNHRARSLEALRETLFSPGCGLFLEAFDAHGDDFVAVLRGRTLCGYVIRRGPPVLTMGAPCPGGVTFSREKLGFWIVGFDMAHPSVSDASVAQVKTHACTLAEWLRRPEVV